MLTTLVCLTAVTLSADEYKKPLGDIASIELIAVGTSRQGPWWSPDGTPIDNGTYSIPKPYQEPHGELYRVAIFFVSEEGPDLISVASDEAVNNGRVATYQEIDGGSPSMAAIGFYADEAPADFKPTLRVVVEPWKAYKSYTPATWLAEDRRRDVQSVADTPMTIVRPLGKTSTLMTLLYPASKGRLRAFAELNNGREVAFEGSYSPFRRQVGKKMEVMDGVSGFLGSVKRKTGETVASVRLETRAEELFTFDGVARGPKS